VHSLYLRHQEQIVYRKKAYPTINTLADGIMAIRARAPLGRDQLTTAHLNPDDAMSLLADSMAVDSLLLRANETVWLLGAQLHTDSSIPTGTFEIRAHLITKENPCLP